MRKVLYWIVLVAWVGSSLAQEPITKLKAEDIERMYKKNTNLPKGAEEAILLGDKSTNDLVVQRLRFPANYHVPPHTHNYDETVIVISGKLGFGEGTQFEKKGEMFKAGSFYAQPARHAHYIWTEEEGAVIQVQFDTDSFSGRPSDCG
jgi:quercetin dioxygenase-like cupin family protein